MISNQILQSTIDGLKEIGHVDLCVMDVDGKTVAYTRDMWEIAEEVVKFAKSPADSQEVKSCQFFKVFDEIYQKHLK